MLCCIEIAVICNKQMPVIEMLQCELVVDNMHCIDHTETNCDCKPSSWTLLYRHTASELDNILDALKDRAECLPRWIERVNSALDSKSEQKAG